MIYLIYRCYYVLFLYYSNYKRETPWISAMFVLTAWLVCLLISAFEFLGILDVIHSNTKELNPLARRGKVMILLVIPLCVVSWFIIYQIIFNLAKASKESGLSGRYAFTPTKGDKIICWLIWF